MKKYKKKLINLTLFDIKVIFQITSFIMSKNSKNNEKSIEQRFKKLKDQHEHVLKRPGMYIGSVKEESATMWVYNVEGEESDPEIIYREISYVPGLYKIFDEILVNAGDHVTRCIEEGREKCTQIKVDIGDNGIITIWNNGAGIPVTMHKEHKMLVPTMLFSDLLSSGNYNDDEKRKVGGTNGLGAKLTNIYSKVFEVETVDSEKKKFYQKFSNNMYTKDEPRVTNASVKKSYTKISFLPDYEKFGIDGLTEDMKALFKKRIYDIAMTSKVSVYFNGDLMKTNNFAKYVDAYFPDESEHKKVMDITNENWRVCVVFDPTDKLEHQNISFVNGICTSRGGTHVDYVTNQIVNKIRTSISKKAKNLVVKPTMIKENLIFFIDALIDNPEFDTQTKEFLKSKVADFGSTYTAPANFLQKIIATGVVDQIIANAQSKADVNLARLGKGKGSLNYSKLYDAHKARLKQGVCTLILTEGDSAKAFAVAGLNVIGRDFYGVFPLKGKLLNVRNESSTKITNNEEIQAIIRIVGLDIGKEYDTLKGLRYGSIMILTDQDVDGSHIKGLIINFIHCFWPSLTKHEGFIKSFATPLLKASKGTGQKKQILEFYSSQEIEKWKNENREGKGWNIKYYKGLGTSTSKEAQELFENVEEKTVDFYWLKEKSESDDSQSEEEPVKKKKGKCIDISEDAITLAFAKHRENDRKIWLNTYDSQNYIDSSDKRVSYYDFINKELIAFSVYDTARSVPNIMDGFKPGQRKVFHGCVIKNIYKKSIKVAQLSGFISEHTHYHHGEDSLNKTIVKMAQNYVGSNNINLLIPEGQFGSRMCGGKDSASPRYIFTLLDDLTKKIFIENDYDVLQEQYEDNDKIEPMFYAPVIPMILINGIKGIGTGYSSSIEPCNPRDVIDNIKRKLSGEKLRTMKPWFRHFTGVIEKIGPNKYISRAKYEKINDDTIHITDLPIGRWTDEYKAFLIKLTESGGNSTKTSTKNATAAPKGKRNNKNSKYLAKKSAKSGTAKVAKQNIIGRDIKSYKEDCTDIRISITIVFNPGKLREHEKKGTLEKNLKLITPLNLTNMHLFDEKGKIRKYESYGEILENYYNIRLKLYQKRKKFLLGKWRKEADMLKHKLQFVQDVRNEKILVFKKKTAEIIEQLENLEYPKFVSKNENKTSYDYLTSLTIIRFSKDEVAKLREQIKNKETDIQNLENKSDIELWEEELNELEIAYDKWEKECDSAYNQLLLKKKIVKRQTRRTSKKELQVEI